MQRHTKSVAAELFKNMKKNLSLLILFCMTACCVYGYALTSFTVKYMISYDAEKQVYTAWVVPDYDTPNYNNADTEEKGATAQFTLKVPKGFVLSQIQDIRGTWDKSPVKLGSETVFREAGIAAEYYVIGKAPSETNYGTFRKGEPVALFTFRGNLLDSPEVQAIENGDPFISIADRKMSLNAGSSFYSRSGQKPTVTAQPLEQFTSSVKLATVLTDLKKRWVSETVSSTGELNSTMQLLSYPNPATNLLTIKYFLGHNDLPTQVELIDLNGQVRQSTAWNTVRGINTLAMNVSKMVNGSYIVRLSNRNEVVSKKVLIQK